MTSLLSLALLASLSGSVSSDRWANEVGPFVQAEVAIVGHIDLTRLDADRVARPILKKFIDEDEVDATLQGLTKWAASLQHAGAKDLYLLLGPADLPGPPVVVVPLVSGANAKEIGQILCGSTTEKPLYAWPTCATIHNAVFAGTTLALDRARKPVGATRPELARAFAVSSEGPIQVLVLPSQNHRRILEELIPILPKEVGGSSITSLTQGLIWASISLEMKPKPTLQIVTQSKDPEAAQRLIQIGTDAVKLVGKSDDLKVITKATNDQVVAEIDLERAVDLTTLPYQVAMEGSLRTQCVENIKQIGLALHNYHSTHGSFPPAVTRDKEGKPLLSWRVLILPYLEQQQLFNEFHLNEPWDSPHNKPLIARIPPTLISPKESRKLRKSGKTTFLAPLGKSAIFTGGAGVKINEVTDGTSNTIMVVDASDALAVEWTKPVDWDVDLDLKKDVLFGHYPNGAFTLFADGSARFIKQTVSLATLKNLLTRNGKEPLRNEDF